MFDLLKKKKIMTLFEYNLYKILVEELSDKYYVFPQICVRSLFRGEGFLIPKKVRWLICDFVLFDKDGYPVKVIELNDSTHQQILRYNRDKRLRKFFNNTGLQVIFLNSTGDVDRFRNSMKLFIDSIDM